MSVPGLKKIHIGRNIERIRELKGIKQETLAQELGISQQAVSKMEQSEDIDNDKLQRIAAFFEMPAEAIKNLNEDALINNINCNFSDNAINTLYQFNPTEKMVELYERLLKEKDEMITILKAKAK